MKDFSPEERLLRLIRSKAKKEMPSEVQKAEQKLEPKAAISVSVAPVKKDDITPRKPKRIFGLEALNLVLVILLCVLLLYLVSFLFIRPKAAIENLEERLRVQQKAGAEKKEKVERPPFDYFFSPAASRNFFSPVIKEEAQPQMPIEALPKLEEIKAQLNLLGVIGGDNPQAIIEDKKVQKTYFVYKGDSIDGIEVKEILENKVILLYKEQQFELVL